MPRDFTCWLTWFIVLVMILLGPVCKSPSVLSTVPIEIWQSTLDPVSWLGQVWRWRWYAAWWQVRHWINELERWWVLAVRLWGCRNLVEVIQALTRQQVFHYLGALPVLLAMLKGLQVREIVNRQCPTHSPVDHGAVTLVLVLNRLMAPRPLYKVMDWLTTTLLPKYLGIAVEKFNDDRLGRSLDALSEHLPAIWAEIQQQTLLHYKIDLSILFYDLTAMIMAGQYPKSELVDYGFAHNTPADDPKVKLGMVVNQDGALPLLFQPWSGRTADKATVQTNMQHLRQFLQQQGWSASQVLVVGDCANLNSELAFAYAEAGLRYLAGLAKLEKVHRELVLAPSNQQFERMPLGEGYWGVACEVPFTSKGQTMIQRGLIVRSDPIRQALERKRQQDLRQLLIEIHQVKGKIGQKRYRSEAEVRQRVATRLERSSVGKLIGVQVSTTAQGQIELIWWIDANALQSARRTEGRFLLVTNDFSLSYLEMLRLYRQKDAVEKRFEVCKQELKIRPLYVHSDHRIQAMLLINLIALLVYSLLERQAEQHGLCLTTRRILDQLATLQVQEIEAWDDSRTWSLYETAPGQKLLLMQLLLALDEKPHAPLPTGPFTRRLLPAGLPRSDGSCPGIPSMSTR